MNFAEMRPRVKGLEDGLHVPQSRAREREGIRKGGEGKADRGRGRDLLQGGAGVYIYKIGRPLYNKVTGDSRG